MLKISLADRTSKRKQNGQKDMIKKVNAERNILRNRPLKWRESKLTVGNRTIIAFEKQQEWNDAERKGNHLTDYMPDEKDRIPALCEAYKVGKETTSNTEKR